MNPKDHYAGAEVDPEPQSPFEALSNACEYLRDVEKRVDALADRMCGQQPEQKAEAPKLIVALGSGNGLIDGMGRNVRDLRAIAEACMKSLDRIERRL